MPQKCLHYDFDFFVDLAKQTAVKRVSHKKFWNVVIHVITSSLISWCSFYLLGCFLPAFIMKLHLATVIIICVAQDIYIGVLFSPVYVAIFYHAMFLTTISWLQTVSLLMLTVLTQVFVGQKWIENTEPLSGPHKSDSTLFAAFDLHNDVFIAPFHYAVTLLMRLDFREDLRWKSDTELRKIMTRTQPIP